ncbi:MAG: signal peptidase I [Bacteroidales bacterium]|nr:signal peptidase I [Bacteroidales bacterium]
MKFYYGWFLPFVLAFIISSLLYVAFRDNVCIVRSGGMMPTIVKGEILLVKNAGKIQKNDILLIDNPIRRDNKKDIHTVKRCVGLPGDTVEIKAKKLFINGELQRTDFCQFDRKFCFFSINELKTAARRYNIFPVNNTDMTQTVAVPESLFKKIRKENIIKNFSDNVLPDDLADRSLYPFSRLYNWNRDFYGPLVVPKKGLTLKLSIKSLILYRFLIEKFEGVKIVVQDNKFYIDGKPVLTYTFKHDYYFVLNDYRDDVSDSRTFGLVQRDLVLGKYFYSVIF